MKLLTDEEREDLDWHVTWLPNVTESAEVWINVLIKRIKAIGGEG